MFIFLSTSQHILLTLLSSFLTNTDKYRTWFLYFSSISTFLWVQEQDVRESAWFLKTSFLGKSRGVWLIGIRCSFVHFSSCCTSGVLVIPLPHLICEIEILPHLIWLQLIQDAMIYKQAWWSAEAATCWEIKNRISYPFQFFELWQTLSYIFGGGVEKISSSNLLKPKMQKFGRGAIKIWILAIK